MVRGRPKLPDGEKMVHVSMRMPAWLLAECRERGVVSKVVRKALEDYLTL